MMLRTFHLGVERLRLPSVLGTQESHQTIIPLVRELRLENLQT